MIHVLDNGLEISNGNLQFAWFKLSTQSGDFFRCVALHELTSIPFDVNNETDTLGLQWAALKGIYDARVDYIYTAMGIFHPDHIGVVQLYGSAATAETMDAAAERAVSGLTAVRAALANFRQSQTNSPRLEWLRWYLDFVNRARPLALLGYPDPRSQKRGLGREGDLPDYGSDDLATEQNEILFRGLAKIRQDFVFQVTANHVRRGDLARAFMDIARFTSNFASRQRGVKSIGFSLGVPIMAALGQGVSGSQGATHSHGQTTSDGVAQTDGTSHTDSHSKGISESWGTSEGQTHSVGKTTGTSDGVSSGTSHSDSSMSSSGKTVSHGTSTSAGGSSGWSQAGSTIVSHGTSVGQSFGTGATHSESQGESSGATESASVSAGASAGLLGTGVSTTGTYSGGVQQGVQSGASDGNSTSHGNSYNTTTGYTQVHSYGTNGGSSWSSGKSDSVAKSSSSGSGSSDGISAGKSHAVSAGMSETWSTSTSKSHANGISEAWGTADSVSHSDGQSHMVGQSTGNADSRMLGQSWNSGFSTGLAPGVNIGRSWQTEDDVAIRLTEMMRQFEAVANQAAQEGGFMTDVNLLVEEPGVQAAQTLAAQAFHGTNVPAPVVTVPVPDANRENILAFYPNDEINAGDDAITRHLWTTYGTLLTAGQVAAYTSPGIVEESTAVVTIAPTPRGLTFYPTMPGDVILGHQYSPLTRDLTSAPVRLDEARLFHTMFAADTGFGKSVAAMRMAYETTTKWHLRTVVLDFGAGWRSLLNAPGLEGHVDIRQLWPSAPRSLRWNPIQIGRNINPETQWRAFADIFGSVAHLGVKRQKQELLDALRTVYIKAGVLVDDREVRTDPIWGKVQPDEVDITNELAGTPLANLDIIQLQKLAVYRSRVTDLMTLYREVEDKLSRVNPRDTMLNGVLEGIIYRMNGLVQGAAASMFAAGADCVPMEDLAKPWGVAIIEGGSFLDDFGKAFLLGWTGWHLYTDMVARRVHEVNTGEPILQIFFEEANKIFGGVDGGGGDDDSGGVSLSQRFGDMFRDARKYLARMHVITQAPSLIPPDIVSSCNNVVIGMLKSPKDKDIVLAAIARSEKGFVDEPWRRFMTDMQIGMFIGRFSYSMEREMGQPFLFRPMAVIAPEPSDREIEAKLGSTRE
ncbi:ATP-binding protein [bacterium]|nr:ATP-binding protein [bacterium]OIO85209.1 MAG: hypothetical protein AUK01_06925 [Anaerolineae bacterium CG2_30_57_67]